MKESKNQRIEGSKIERVQEPGRELPSIVFLRVASCFSAWRHSCKRVKTRWRSFKSSLHVETLRSSFDSSTRVIENRKVVSKIVVLNLNKYRLDKSRSESRAKRDPNEKSGDQERERIRGVLYTREITATCDKSRRLRGRRHGVLATVPRRISLIQQRVWTDANRPRD